jgi:PPM family protein phosphatase
MTSGSQTSAMAADSIKTRPGVEVAWLTDVGRVRENNEDSYLYWEPHSPEEFRRKGRLAVVADGMGGYEGGQEASRLAVQTVRHVYENKFHENAQITLVDALIVAHETIQRYGEQHPEVQGMGTTCTAISIINRELVFAHIGDSRLYLIGGNTVTRLTRDHSYVGRLVESGIVRSEDAESHPQRHILTAALGSGREILPDSPEMPVQLKPGDSLLLCTDGLWSVLHEQDFAHVVRANPPSEACRHLVQMALDRGGPDNVTLLILKIVD